MGTGSIHPEGMGRAVIRSLQWTLNRTVPGAVAWAGDLVWDGSAVPQQHDAVQECSRWADQVLAAAVPPVDIPAVVPGTAAGALLQMGPIQDIQNALEHMDNADWWWCTQVALADQVDGVPVRHWQLQLRGVATVCEVFWGGQRVAHSISGLRDIVVQLPAGGGVQELAIVCRAPSLVPVPRKPRPRWRSTLVADSSVRWRRTPLIGRIPWAGTYPVVGPWGDVALEPVPEHGVEVSAVRTQLHGMGTVSTTGTVHVQITAQRQAAVTITCAGVAVQRVLEAGEHHVVLEVKDPQLWWPATHGHPMLHRLTVTARHGQRTTNDPAAQTVVADHHVGFRQVEALHENGGFALVVNGRKIFARGAVWTPLDPVTLGAQTEDIERTVRAMRAAGANILRISGTHAWEQEAFYRACDRYGLLVWHDAMLATLDPPSDSSWLALVDDELRTWLPRLGAHPCVAVFSGGNEVLQQPVLWGRDMSSIEIPVIDDLLPDLCDQLMPQVVYVPSSPSGGNPPTRVDTGVSHWFGVGAYRRPLSDTRTSGVRFAAEALAFGVPPAPSVITETFGSPTADHNAAAQAAWRSAAAQDPGASWDFEDTTVHYARRWLEPGLEADTGAVGGAVDLHSRWEHLPRADQLQAERIAAAHAVEHTMTDLRRNDSTCDGVIILSSRDVLHGPGWGLLDASGRPKSTWYAMRRACADLAVRIVDEGLSGLHIHVFHDRPGSFAGMMHVDTWTSNNAAGPTAQVRVDLDGPGEKVWNLEQLLGGFLDLDHAWGFGQRQWEAVAVQLVPDTAPTGVHSLRDVRLLGAGHRDPVADLREGLMLSQHSPPTEALRYDVGLSTAHAAVGVSVDAGAHLVPDDDVMTFVPGEQRILTVVPVNDWPAAVGVSRRGGND